MQIFFFFFQKFFFSFLNQNQSVPLRAKNYSDINLRRRSYLFENNLLNLLFQSSLSLLALSSGEEQNSKLTLFCDISKSFFSFFKFSFQSKSQNFYKIKNLKNKSDKVAISIFSISSFTTVSQRIEYKSTAFLRYILIKS